MKKIITLALCAAMLVSAVPASFADSEYPELTLDSASYYEVSEDGYLLHTPNDVTAAELLSNFKDKDNVKITAKDGTPLTLLDKVGSDAAVSYSKGEKVLKTYMAGDLNGDAKISAKDVSALIKNQAGFDAYICAPASDVNGDGNTSAKDVSTLLKYLADMGITISKPAYVGEKAENEDTDIDWYFTSIMNRVGRSDTNINGKLDYTVRMAKNEIEDAEIVMTTTADKKGYTLEVGDIVNENGAKLDYTVHYGYYWEFAMFYQLRGKDYSKITEDYWADAFPYLNGSFDLTANQSSCFMLRIVSTADADAGFYTTKINVKDADGRIVKTATLRVYVWDIELEEETALSTAFDLGRYTLTLSLDKVVENVYHMSDNEIRGYYAQWYEYMLENRICAYELPYAVGDERNQKYIDNPRVNSFCVVGGSYSMNTGDTPEQTNANIAQIYRENADDPNWLEKAYIYTIDEPCTNEQLDTLEAQYNYLKEAIPDIDFQIVCPLAGNQLNSAKDGGKDYVQRVFDVTQILVPSVAAFNPYVKRDVIRQNTYEYPNYYSCDYFSMTRVYEKYGEFSDRYANYKAEGKKGWSYVCIGPEFPFANFFIYYQGQWNRMVLWQQYHNNSEGLLYWSVNVWQRNEKDSSPITLRRTHVNGDGLLLYTGQLWNQGNVPVPSPRFEAVRDGIEDYQYLAQLEEYIGRDEVMKYVNKLTINNLCFVEDMESMVNVRDEVAYLLESMD